MTEWARLVLLTMRRRLPGRAIVAIMDGEFAALELLHALRPSMAVITRMRKDARLFDSPSYEDKPGRPARKGKRQPLLSARIADPATRWLRVVQSSRTSWRSAGWIEYAHGTALWHHGGKPIVPILWVLVRYPDGRREPEAFLCTDTQGDPRNVLTTSPAYWQGWDLLRAQIGGKFHALFDAVSRAMADSPRSSSLVEKLNSRLRPCFTLRRHLGGSYLNLLRFFLNHRRFLRSRHTERQGRSPHELMTGQGHPHWLTLLGLGPLQPQRA